MNINIMIIGVVFNCQLGSGTSNSVAGSVPLGGLGVQLAIGSV